MSIRKKFLITIQQLYSDIWADDEDNRKDIFFRGKQI